MDRSWMVARGRFLCDYRATEGGGAIEMQPGLVQGWRQGVGGRTLAQILEWLLIKDSGRGLCHDDPQSMDHELGEISARELCRDEEPSCSCLWLLCTVVGDGDVGRRAAKRKKGLEQRI